MENKKPVAVVVGAGPGNGTALARRFVAGHAIAVLARRRSTLAPIESELAGTRGFECDVGDPSRSKVPSLTSGEKSAKSMHCSTMRLRSIRRRRNDHARTIRAVWRVNAYGSLLCARQVIPGMKARGAGAIIFVGATASRRGGVQAAAFAPAKAAQRSLAESMARKLWPEGVHVALIVIDGVVDLPGTRALMPGKPDDAFVDPAGVAEIAFQLRRQQRRAWSFEVEARPYAEKW